ncbi:uncharacterized membrane protein YozB (DUF420 family) [Oikeobacillus pervagus]|uniref:Uncharacterized membrane protein YozB (DUF420 family) n=1 Tax=Oikeobacillus pervagus TaxID=1325931 RepID=A0AAJ1WJU5_9BACI|nr:hypothetical protein [Oikeobacillus pervagus]MDQ0216030.1 uncharacterized membrane protein YozB (DUF420 family) [Oikeobacillus pervagus]
MIFIFSLLLTTIVLFIDRMELKAGSRKEKGVYYTILIVFFLVMILKQMQVSFMNPFEWLYNHMGLVKEIYLFLETKG